MSSEPPANLIDVRGEGSPLVDGDNAGSLDSQIQSNPKAKIPSTVPTKPADAILNKEERKKRNEKLAPSGAASTSSDNPLLGSDVSGQASEVLEAPFSITLGDGDVFANKRIVANGGKVNINAQGDDWIIKNVGVEGASTENPISVRVNSQSSHGVIEHVCIEGVDGPDEAALFVHRDHSGTITIRNFTAKNVNNSHGIYASTPGYPPWGSGEKGSGGAVEIEACYAKAFGDHGFRIGSDGSYVKGCVADSDSSLPEKFQASSIVWNRWNNGVAEDCRGRTPSTGFTVGSNSLKARDGECVLHTKNCTWDASKKVEKRDGVGDWTYFTETNLTKDSDVDLTPPSGCPLTAKEAAGV